MITADTNVFVYAADRSNLPKQQTATRIIATMRAQHARIALQVVGEFQNAISRKLKVPRALAAERALMVLESFATFPASRSAARAALREVEARRLSYWDALMIASAAEAGCTAMLTEDLQDGAVIFGLEIVNPFREHGVSPRAAELLDIA